MTTIQRGGRALAIASIVFLGISTAHAKGGAGGTPAPECDADEYTCANWGPEPCPQSGQQTRTCTKTFDCPGVNTPAPDTTRSCTFVPTCTEDTYECEDWFPEKCPEDGEQVRFCVLTFDCPGVETPDPSGERTCTFDPGCDADQYDCDEWGPKPCPENGRQTRNCTKAFDCPGVDTVSPDTLRDCTPPPKPSQEVVPTPFEVQEFDSEPECTQDVWDCDLWSACGQDGRERRNCTLTFDCDEANDPKPETERICPGLKCGHLPTRQERIACRLDLSDKERQAESNILYFPEYCREQDTDEKKSACIDLYWRWEPCWRLGAGPNRAACGREAIGFGNFKQDVKDCVEKGPVARDICFQEIVDKVRNMVLFSLYELEFKAEELLSQGRVNTQDVVTLISEIETAKINISVEKKHSNWKPLILEARGAWKTFTDTVQ